MIALASRPHYAAHMAPVAALVGPQAPDVTLVASYHDHVAARRRGASTIVVMEHGIGQAYPPGRHPGYPGGRDRGDAALFLAPNEYSARRWRAAYPAIPAVAIGSPRLDSLPGREPGPGPVVAVTWHWQCAVGGAWGGNAWSEYHHALPELAERWTVIGTGHPRIIAQLEPVYRRLGIEVVRDLDEVFRRADVLVGDNTSALFEFASTGRPVVLMNARRWAPGDPSAPGLRFWEASGVGINVRRAAHLADGVAMALEDPPKVREARDTALLVAYARRHGAAAEAADAIVRLAA